VDQSLICHTIEGGYRLFSLPLPHRPCSLAVSDRFVGVGGVRPNQLCFVDFSGRMLQQIPTDDIALSICFDRTGRRLACGFSEGAVALFDEFDSEWSLTQRWETKSRNISTIMWIDDNTFCFGSWNGTIGIWDCVSGGQTHYLQDSGMAAFCLTSHEDHANVIFGGCGMGVIHKHNLSSNCCVDLKPHNGTVRAMCIEDNMIVTCSDDNTVAAFDIMSFSEKWRYTCANWATSMFIVENEVFVGVFSSDVVVLDLKSGTFVRNYPTQQVGLIYTGISALPPPIRFKFAE